LSLLALVMALVAACGAPKNSVDVKNQSFIAPGYVKKSYNKILVLAHVDPDIFRRRIERNVIEAFRNRKYNVAGSLDFFKPEMANDSLALRKEILDRGFDAALVLTYIGEMTGVNDVYNYNGNVYTVFGGGFPVFDLDTKATKTYYFQADFFTLEGKGTQWRFGASFHNRQDPDAGLSDMANKIRRKMQDDKIL
jgi:hypothetical protein